MISVTRDRSRKHMQGSPAGAACCTEVQLEVKHRSFLRMPEFTHLTDSVTNKEYAGTQSIDSVAHVDVRLELEGRKGQVGPVDVCAELQRCNTHVQHAHQVMVPQRYRCCTGPHVKKDCPHSHALGSGA